jgi:NitT/TauT family transport system substrate-binding protein
MAPRKRPEHADPPSFAKWLMWIFRRQTWRDHPIIAIIASVITLSTALTAAWGLVGLIPPPNPTPASNPAATSNGSAPVAEPIPVVRVGIKQFVGYTPLAVANEMKLFEREGVHVDFITTGDLSDTRRKFARDEIDVVMWLINWHADYTSDGSPAKVILKLDTSLGADAVLARDGIKTAADIKRMLANGEMINAVLQLNEPSHYLLDELCREHGIPMIKISPSNSAERVGKIGYIHGSPKEAAEILKAGHKDGVKYQLAGTYEPFISELRKLDNSIEVVISGAHRPDAIVDVLAVKPAFLDGKRHCAEALVRAWFSALDILDEGSKDERHSRAVELAKRFNHVLPDDMNWNARDWPTYPMQDEDDYWKMVRPDQIQFANRSANRLFFNVVADSSKFRKVFSKAQEQLHVSDRFPRLPTADDIDGSQSVFTLFDPRN